MLLERNSENAAAYIGLKVHVETHKTTRAATGQQRIHFLLGPTWQPPQGGKPQPTAKLRAQLSAGSLPPTHPLCRQLLASENRRHFIAYLKDPRLGLRSVDHHGAQRLQHATGSSLPGITAAKDDPAGVFKTKSIRTAIALMTAGHRLLAIEGAGDTSLFYVAHHGPEGTASTLLTTWRTEPILFPPDSVFLLSMAFLQNREILIAHINKMLGRILLEKPNDPKHRSIDLPENASGRTWDKAKKFLLG